MSESGNGNTWVNTRLEATAVADLARIQVHHGIKSRSDTIRYLIRQEARRIGQPMGPTMAEILAAAKLGTITPEEAIEALAGHSAIIG